MPRVRNSSPGLLRGSGARSSRPGLGPDLVHYANGRSSSEKEMRGAGRLPDLRWHDYGLAGEAVAEGVQGRCFLAGFGSGSGGALAFALLMLALDAVII